MEHISTIIIAAIAAISTIVTAWFVYNQKTKDKKTDLKIEKMKAENIEKMALNNRHIAIIHGEMWELLHKLDADRCFIIQPHPEHKHLFLSVAFEVDRKGISAVKDIFQNVPISDMAGFVKKIATECWIYYDDVAKQVDDRKAQSMMFLAGSTQIAIRQLVDVNGSWIGSLVLENITEKHYEKQIAMDSITESGNVIQFVLPPIN
jgi:hypothetical protein